MKKITMLVLGGMFCCFLALMAGCSSSKLTDVWSDSSFHSPSLNKILVISVGKNAVKRRIWEDAFASEFAKHNVAATPSYRLFPDATPDTDQVLQTVQANGFDGVLVTSWLPPETNPEYSPGFVTTQQNMRFGGRRGGFGTYYREIYLPGYIDSQKVNIRSIDVWATKDNGEMIWSATSKTPDSNSGQAVQSEIVKLVMSELTQRDIIASER